MSSTLRWLIANWLAKAGWISSAPCAPALGATTHLPVVVMTVDPSREVMLEAILSGANSVLAKPLSIRTLSQHLARAISANPIHVPFGPLALPLSLAMARDLGPRGMAGR